MLDEVLSLNEHYIECGEKLERAGLFFAETKLNEITVVDENMQPAAILDREHYIDNYAFSDRPISELLPFGNSFIAVSDMSGLHDLIMNRAEYCVLVDGNGAFQALASKKKLIARYLKEQDNFIFSLIEFAKIINLTDLSYRTFFTGQKKSASGIVDNKTIEHFNKLVWVPYIKDVVNKETAIEGKKLFIGGEPFLAYAVPIKKNGELLGVAGIFFNSLEAQVIIGKINKLQQLYEENNTIIETSYDGFTITDGKGIILRVNKAHERITGSKPEDMIGKHVTECVKGGELSNPVTMRVLKEKKTITLKQRVRNGKQIIVTGSPVFNKNGEIIRVVCNLRDVSEFEALQEKLNFSEKARKRDRIELEHLRRQQMRKGNIIANSNSMKEIIQSAENVAGKDVPVLILGETGVGKEIIATMIHKSSLRQNGPFLKINCGAIPANLLETELFGYQEGAFTGAAKGGKIGLFEAAHGGTVFLDEIGELSLDLQVKLLRVIQEKEVTRIGSNSPVKIDARFIFATNKDLKKMVKSGQFREDLYYRLYVFPISIPPLRHRKEDIIPLADYFLEVFNRKYGTKKVIDDALKKKFARYTWPGNVRELENLIERLVISSYSDVIDESNISQFGIDIRFREHLDFDQATGGELLPLNEASANFERRLIINALKHCKTMAAAAEALQVDRTTICRKINKYKILYPYTE